MREEIEVEVVFASADGQRLVTLSLAPGATVADAIEASALQDRFRDENLDFLTVGIWGRIVPRDTVLSAGDRIEIYRPLQLEPREARRQLAALGRTMGATRKES